MKWTTIAMVVFAGTLLAQGPFGPGSQSGPPQPKTDQVKAYLGLSDAQIQSLQQLKQQEMTALKPIFQQMFEAQKNLREQLRSGSTDATALGTLQQNIQNLRKQISQTSSSYHDQALALLTPDQVTKLKTLEDAAKLFPTIHEAGGLNLMTRPENQNGPGGPGMRPMRFGPRGPRGF